MVPNLTPFLNSWYEIFLNNWHDKNQQQPMEKKSCLGNCDTETRDALSVDLLRFYFPSNFKILVKSFDNVEK